MLSVHITALTDEELDEVAAGLTVTRSYTGGSIKSDITGSSITVLGITVETLKETTTVTPLKVA